MRRKRLRPLLEEVLGDADLHANAARVAGMEPVDSPAPTSFPAPPWQSAAEVTSANGHAAAGAPPEVGPVEHPFAAPLADAQSTPPGDSDPAALADAFPVDPIPGGSAAPPVDRLPLPADVAVPPPPTAAVVEPPARDAPRRPEPAVAVPVPVAPLTAAASAAAPPAKPPVTLTGGADLAAGRRRRRSASLLPPLPAPADMPDDTAGRVAITSLPVPPGTVATPTATGPSSAEPAPITAVGGEAALAGWLPVLALGAALVLLFIVGVLVTR